MIGQSRPDRTKNFRGDGERNLPVPPTPIASRPRYRANEGGTPSAVQQTQNTMKSPFHVRVVRLRLLFRICTLVVSGYNYFSYATWINTWSDTIQCMPKWIPSVVASQNKPVPLNYRLIVFPVVLPLFLVGFISLGVSPISILAVVVGVVGYSMGELFLTAAANAVDSSKWYFRGSVLREMLVLHVRTHSVSKRPLRM